MEKKYDVYGIGNALVDLEFRVEEHFLNEHSVKKGLMTLVDEEKQAELIAALDQDDTNQKPGGSAANTIIAVRQLGGSAFYSCKVANDAHGNFYINDMHNTGIDTNYLHQKPEDGITGKCMVMITDDTDRTMNTFLGITARLSTLEVDEEAIKNAQYVYIEGYLAATDAGFKAMRLAKKIAEKNGVKTAITLSDPSIVAGFTERFTQLMEQKVDFLFCNEEEAKNFTGKENFAEILDKLKEFASAFAVTRGADGAVIFDGNELIEVKPVEVTAVDTNGAGDMFAGTFLYGITNGLNFKEAGDLASQTSAKVVSQYGPRLSKDVMQEIIKVP